MSSLANVALSLEGSPVIVAGGNMPYGAVPLPPARATNPGAKDGGEQAALAIMEVDRSAGRVS